MNMQPGFQSLAILRQSPIKEIFRKIIHLTISFVPMMADWNMPITVVLLCGGILFYVVNETARITGAGWGLISRITLAASRPMEEKGFVWGPVTLGLGTMTALLYYPNPASTLAIYALAFGDGVGSLVGRIWGRHRVPWVGEKTFIGSMACFAAVFAGAYFVLGDFRTALLTAGVATLFELFPLRDIDNLIIPLGTGLVLSLVL